jgi:hypothetical protein
MNQRLDAFTRSYIETALWSSTDNANDQGGEPLDKNYNADDISPETMAQMIADALKFQKRNAELLYDSNLDDERAGHYFWLSRNGHGSGFFDEGLDKLQDAARAYGAFDLYIGDDGQIWGSPLEQAAGVNEYVRSGARIESGKDRGPITPGYNQRLFITFKTDKHGKPRAYYWGGTGSPGTLGRWIPMSPDKARDFIAQGYADEMSFTRWTDPRSASEVHRRPPPGRHERPFRRDVPVAPSRGPVRREPTHGGPQPTPSPSPTRSAHRPPSGARRPPPPASVNESPLGAKHEIMPNADGVEILRAANPQQFYFFAMTSRRPDARVAGVWIGKEKMQRLARQIDGIVKGGYVVDGVAYVVPTKR